MGELLAIQVGLQFVEEKGWPNVVIATDSKQAIQKIQNAACKVAYFAIVNHCRDRLAVMTGVELEYGQRTTNKVADRMAKLGRTDVITSYNILTFEHPPGLFWMYYWRIDPINICCNLLTF